MTAFNISTFAETTLPPIFEGIVPSIYVAIGAVITTGILLFFISYFAYFPAKNYIQKRKEFIQENLDTSVKLKSEAQDLLAKANSDFKAIEQKSNEHFEKISKEAIINKTIIISEAKVKANDIVEETMKQLESERKSMEDKLRKEFVDVSVQIAEKIIKETLDPSKNEKMINDFLKEIESQ